MQHPPSLNEETGEERKGEEKRRSVHITVPPIFDEPNLEYIAAWPATKGLVRSGESYVSKNIKNRNEVR